MRTVLAARRLPLRHGLARLEIDRCGEVVVLVIHIEGVALSIDCIAFRPAFEVEFFFLTQSLAVQNTDRVVAGCGDPNFFFERNIDDAVRGGIDVTAVLRASVLSLMAHTLES